MTADTLATPTIVPPANKKNWSDPSKYKKRAADLVADAAAAAKDGSSLGPRPNDVIDHRPNGGPLLSYVWCDDPLAGQDLYLGAEVTAINGKMYCIPGHAARVLKVDPVTDTAVLIGPIVTPGKYKWLRGVKIGNNVVYGLPCHAGTVLKITVRDQKEGSDNQTGVVEEETVEELPIDYQPIHVPAVHGANNDVSNDVHNDDNGDEATAAETTSPATGAVAVAEDVLVSAEEQRRQEWKYHGGAVSPIDGCIYCIPQSALRVLKIDPTTDKCTLFGPALPGRYKWYGGVVSLSDGAIYGIPHNSPCVLRIHPVDGVTLHGHYPGSHKWHGASRAPNGVIVGVPANADAVLCITPPAAESTSNAPVLELIGADVLQRGSMGRHRLDRKYKYLGGSSGPDGRVYCFPCAAERVLAVDTISMTAREIGPNIYDADLERVCQNKWQNGVVAGNVIWAVPLASESVLKIDFTSIIDGGDDDNGGEPAITTWPLPAPFRGLHKWEGGVLAKSNGVVYTVPNSHKALLRIEDNNNSNNNNASPQTVHADHVHDHKEEIAADNDEALVSNKQGRQKKHHVIASEKEDVAAAATALYQSGIPTLRASAHRVKLSTQHRTHDPVPRDANGTPTGTPWLPAALRQADILAYDDVSRHNLVVAVVELLAECDPTIVGAFRPGSSSTSSRRLEDFVVSASSTWRKVNGGGCEDAQRYLSDRVAANDKFMSAFDHLVEQAVLPYLGRKLHEAGVVVTAPTTKTFYYQRPPTIRIQPGPARAHVKAHNDAEYGHQYGELNFWLPLTDRTVTGVDLYCESRYEADDYTVIPAKVGEMAVFHGSACRHYVNRNASQYARVSFDFRVGIQGYFDPTWEMRGTDDDHTRRTITYPISTQLKE